MRTHTTGCTKKTIQVVTHGTKFQVGSDSPCDDSCSGRRLRPRRRANSAAARRSAMTQRRRSAQQTAAPSWRRRSVKRPKSSAETVTWPNPAASEQAAAAEQLQLSGAGHGRISTRRRQNLDSSRQLQTISSRLRPNSIPDQIQLPIIDNKIISNTVDKQFSIPLPSENCIARYVKLTNYRLTSYITYG